MRLFIAINFDVATKGRLKDIQLYLKKYTNQGNFSREENLHLTLVFLGEILPMHVKPITAAMDAVCNIPPFIMSMSNLGSFRRGASEICWLGIERNVYLDSLFSSLVDNLNATGFTLEKKEYRPHLTLAREVMFKDNINIKMISKTPSIDFLVNNISLMHSERINGILTYNEIFVRGLNGCVM